MQWISRTRERLSNRVSVTAIALLAFGVLVVVFALFFRP